MVSASRLLTPLSLGAALALLSLHAASCDRMGRDVRLREQAQAALRASKPAEAADLFFQAYEANPRGPHAARNLYDFARTEELELNRPEFAVEVYVRFTTAFPKDALAPEALERAARLYSERLDSPQKAIDVLVRLGSDYPDFARAGQARLNVAREYEKIGNRDQAYAKYEQFLRDFPGSPLAPRAWYLLAALQSMQGSYPEAVKSLNTAEAALFSDPAIAAAEAPDFLDLVRIERARAFENMEMPAEAVESYRSVSAHYPGASVIRARIEALETKLAEKAEKGTR